MSKVIAIAAQDENGGIGRKGALPWHCKADMDFFRETTKGHIVMMGRKTFECLPGGPLKNRLNVIVTTSPEYIRGLSDNCIVCTDPKKFIQDFLGKDSYYSNLKTLFVAGGERLYTETLHLCNGIYLTEITGKYKCDRHFPKIPSYFKLIGAREGEGCTFTFYNKSG